MERLLASGGLGNDEMNVRRQKRRKDQVRLSEMKRVVAHQRANQDMDTRGNRNRNRLDLKRANGRAMLAQMGLCEDRKRQIQEKTGNSSIDYRDKQQ